MSKGIFGNMFDLNHDGELNLMEKSMEFMFLDEITKNDEDEKKNDE